MIFTFLGVYLWRTLNELSADRITVRGTISYRSTLETQSALFDLIDPASEAFLTMFRRFQSWCLHCSIPCSDGEINLKIV
jgi:hypothetical protein